MKGLMIGQFILFVAGLYTVFGQTDGRKIGRVVASPNISGWSIPEAADLRNYEIFPDTKVKMNGKQSVSFRSRASDPSSPRFTIMTQTIRATDYENRRIRFSAFIRSDAEGQANLFVNMNGPWMIVTNRDHMHGRLITGSSDWREHQIVLDVPPSTQQLVLGIKLAGKGQIWIDAAKFEVVGSDIPVTNLVDPNTVNAGSALFVDEYRRSQPRAFQGQLETYAKQNDLLPARPRNLDFDDL